MSSFQNSRTNTSQSLFGTIPPEPLFFQNFPMVAHKKRQVTKKPAPSLFRLGQLAEKISCIWAWEFCGHHGAIQPTCRNNKSADFAGEFGSRTWLFDFTTNIKDCFEKLRKYQGDFVVIVIVFGENFKFPDGEFEDSEAHLFGMKKFADKLEPNFPLEAKKLRDIDDLVRRAKEEVKKNISHNKTKKPLVPYEMKWDAFDRLEERAKQKNPDFRRISGGRGDGTWRIWNLMKKIESYI